MADKRVAAAFHEIKKNPPAVLAKTQKKSGSVRAHKQAVAIALSKARAAGARIPKMHEGGEVPESGVYNMKKGERVIPAGHPDAKVKIKIKGADAMNMLGPMTEHLEEEKKSPGIHARVAKIVASGMGSKTEPATQFPLHKLPAAMEIPSNSEGAPVHDFGGVKSRQAENQAKRAQKEASFS